MSEKVKIEQVKIAEEMIYKCNLGMRKTINRDIGGYTLKHILEANRNIHE